MLPDGTDQYRSFLGAMLSILTLITLLGYASFKFESLVSFSDYIVQVSDHENFYDANTKFGIDNDFSIAAGLVDYDGKSHKIEDESIATVKFYRKAYNSSDPDVVFGFEEIPSRYCEPDVDFNQLGNNTKSSFFPTSDVSKADIEAYGPRLKCLQNLNDTFIHGNFDSSAGSNIMVVLEKCDNSTSTVTCKSEEEITNKLTWKYILLLQNQRKFIQYEFGDGRINESSVSTWYSVLKNTRLDNVIMITRSSIVMEDDFYSVPGTVKDKILGFASNRQPSRELPYNNRF